MELSSSQQAAIKSKHNVPMSAIYGEIHESSSSKQLNIGGKGDGNNIINSSSNIISQGGAHILRPDQQQQQEQQQPINTSGTVKKPSPGVRYKECLKNHAANMGGYAVDGCGEFMPSGEEGSIEALKCAACGCHRNFHRREINGSNNMGLLALPSTTNNNSSSSNDGGHGEDQYGHHHHNSSGNINNNNMNNYMQGFHYPSSAHVDFLPHHGHHLGQHHHQYMHSLMNSSKVGHGGGGTSAKRFRTKFTMEQREKMFEFSEKLGWRIQKHDEAAVQQFCAEAGVKRHVLKVWMHNNKNTFGKKLLRFPEAFNPLPDQSS